jgi:hypothetical protein
MQPLEKPEQLALNTEATHFFRDVLTTAFQARRLTASEASEAYLLDLLVEHAGRSLRDDVSQPFAVRLAQAMDAEPIHRFERLRALGDDVLFLSGFFSSHLERRGINREYATGLGQIAYGGAAVLLRRYSSEAPPVFSELSDRFWEFAQLLEHIADSLCASRAYGDGAILELYERYQRTGSTVLASALARLGVNALRSRQVC